MNNENTKTNTNDKKLCFFHEVHDGIYDCNYCGENFECHSCECCYAFCEHTFSDNELRLKVTRVVNNFMDEWDKRHFYTQTGHERPCVRDDMMNMIHYIVTYRTNQFYYMENRLLTLNFDELNELLHMFYELGHNDIESIWHRVNELYFAKCDDYDGPDICDYGEMLYEQYLDNLRAEGAHKFPFAKW